MKTQRGNAYEKGVKSRGEEERDGKIKKSKLN